MVKKNNKKGAVEMSLNLIIMLIIGLVVLGLVIGFVTSFLGSAEDTFKGKLTEDDKTKVEQVKRETGNLAFLSASLKIKQADKNPGKLYIKIRNPTDNLESSNPPNTIFGGGELTNLESSYPLSVSITSGSGGSNPDDITIFGPPIVLSQGQSDGYSLEVYASETVGIGTYYAKFTLDLSESGSPDPNLIYTKIITINVE